MSPVVMSVGTRAKNYVNTRFWTLGGGTNGGWGSVEAVSHPRPTPSKRQGASWWRENMSLAGVWRALDQEKRHAISPEYVRRIQR